MDVDEVMTIEVVTCRADETLGEVASRLAAADVSCAPVVANDGVVVGMLGERDVVAAAVWHGAALDRIPAEAVMRKPVPRCWPNDSLESARAIMRAYGVRRLPVVVPSGRLVGLVSLADIARQMGRRDDPRPCGTVHELVELIAGLEEAARERPGAFLSDLGQYDTVARPCDAPASA